MFDIAIKKNDIILIFKLTILDKYYNFAKLNSPWVKYVITYPVYTKLEFLDKNRQTEKSLNKLSLPLLIVNK